MRFFSRSVRLSACLLCLALLSACGETVDGVVDDMNRGIELGRAEARGYKGSERLLATPCPQIQIVKDLGSLSDFTDDQRTFYENMIAQMDIKKRQSSCELATSSATVDLALLFTGTLGPKARQQKSDKPFLTYPFFVAVTGPNGKIMAKEIFAVSMSFETGETTRTHTEYLRQIIPVRSKETAFQYQVLVGFQLSPEQLNYNRAALAPRNVPIPGRKPQITYVPADQMTEDQIIENTAAKNMDWSGASAASIPVTREIIP